MNGDTRDLLVSRSLYESEKQARLEAEALLKAKDKEIEEINRRLTAETESVRAALANNEAVRMGEAALLKERSILSEALKALTGKTGADEAMQALLNVLKQEIGGRDCFFVRASGKHTVISASADKAHVGHPLPLPASMITKSRRLSKLTMLLDGFEWPGGTDDLAATMIVPLKMPDGKVGAFVLGCKIAGRYSVGDLRTMEQVSKLASQALLTLQEARRNALLVALVEGKPVETTDVVMDAPHEAVHKAFARMTEMQGQVVGILDSLLSAPLSETDAAINAALAQMGAITDTDRTYVFRMRPDGETIDNTHEWCAPGIRSVQANLQGMPVETWDNRAVFEAGREVMIGDVAALPDDTRRKQSLLDHDIKSLLAVPMFEQGTFRGIVGFDAVRQLRNFLPGEVHLIQSVAKVIASVLARRDVEERLVSAHAESSSQSDRFQAVLSAMPDIIVELDRDGRIVSWHPGTTMMSDAVHDTLTNRMLEDEFPAHLSTVLRGKIAELDAGANVVTNTIETPLWGMPTRWWQLTASLIGDQGYVLALRDITEAREKSNEIERLSEIARRTTNLVVVTDVKRRIEWVNDAFVRTTGWTLEEVKGKTPGSILQFNETDPDTILKLREALDKGLPVQTEILNRSKDGREYWLSIDIQPLKDEDGTLQGFMAVESDITERRQQAESLRKAAAEAAAARANLEKAVESLEDGFVLYDADDRLVICNSRFKELYSLAAPAIVPGATFESILLYALEVGQYPASVTSKEDWYAERMKRHKEADREFEQQLPDGTWLRVFEKITPDGGRVGLRVDITKLKLAEQQALSDRATAMEASWDGIAITDADGFYVFVNQSHLEMFGYSEERELLGQNFAVLYRPEELAWIKNNVMPVLMQRGGWSGEITGIAKDGSLVDQDVSLTLKEDGGILCITRDISARRREQAERERLLNELQLAQRREMIGQMAAGLAHDFNNLLAIISGGASLILGDAEEKSQTALGAGRIVAASDQAAGLVKRLLALGARQSERVNLDLRQPVKEAAELVRSSLTAPARLSLSVPDSEVSAMADPTDILQLLLNLAINARDALPAGNGTISIELAPPDFVETSGALSVGRLDSARQYARLTVQDDGPGMTEDIASRILTPYFSTKGDKGTGLGLAVVSSVIEDNAGALQLTTAPGEGTRFDVYWPIEAVEATQSLEEYVEALTGRLDDRMILVVDDQPAVLDVITAYLESAGAEVAASTDPEDALSALKDAPDAWDLLVTDFDMPGMNGAQLAEAAKTIKPTLPIILVTALAGEAGRSGALFASVLPKPIDRHSLVQKSELALISAREQSG